MAGWEADYYDMEVPAHFEIRKDRSGSFQFGLVRGELDGRVVEYPFGERFEFTGEGNDENDLMSGSGWLHLTGNDDADGEIRIHRGDDSKLMVRRIASKSAPV